MAVPKRYDSSILPEDKVGLVLVELSNARPALSN